MAVEVFDVLLHYHLSRIQLRVTKGTGKSFCRAPQSTNQSLEISFNKSEFQGRASHPFINSLSYLKKKAHGMKSEKGKYPTPRKIRHAQSFLPKSKLFKNRIQSFLFIRWKERVFAAVFFIFFSWRKPPRGKGEMKGARIRAKRLRFVYRLSLFDF